MFNVSIRSIASILWRNSKMKKNYIGNYWSRLSESAICELVELFGDKMSWPETGLSYKWRDRTFNQWRTFWIFLGQILSYTQACAEAVHKAQIWLLYSEQKKISSKTTAYCNARNRLDKECLDKLNEQIISQQEQTIQSQYLWCGRDVKVVDGTCVSMPDTEKNQELYPQPSGQAEGCGFPVMKIVASFSLATGSILAFRTGNLHNHERLIWHKMWDCYEEGDVVLADRGFCSLCDFELLSQKGVDCVMRLHQRRKKHDIIEKFSSNDYLVSWKKEKDNKRPDWITPQQWEQIPPEITVRYITVIIENPGFRTQSFVVATTLLDPEKYPPQAIADLYRKRWMAELFLRDIKTTMHMDILRCKSPEMIHKELIIFIIAYNLIRGLIWESALKKGIDPYQISFKEAMVAICHWSLFFTFTGNRNENKKKIEILMLIITTCIKPNRKKHRKEPRAIKRRPKSYQYLTKPRDQFVEIPHRSKYTKDKYNEI